MKSCIVCLEEKPLASFHKKASNVGGRDNRCAPCKNAKRRERYANNKEYEDKRNQAWMDKNRKKFQEYNKDYYEKNKQDYAPRTAKRRAQKLKATPSWANQEKIKQLYIECRELEAKFLAEGIVMTFNVDHIIPLQHPLVCGLHVENNLQILTASENFRKSNAFDVR